MAAEHAGPGGARPERGRQGTDVGGAVPGAEPRTSEARARVPGARRRSKGERRVREAERVAGIGNRKKKEKERENVISPLFSLLNRLQPVRSVLWPNFTEPECLRAKC